MKKTIINISFVCLTPTALWAQTYWVSDDISVNVSAGTDVKVMGNISQQNNAVWNNQGNTYLTGNYAQNTGAVYNGNATSWLWFEGSSNQLLMGDAPITIDRLRVDNGNELWLQQHLKVSIEADLRNNGSIRLGNFNIDAQTAMISNYDENNYIITDAVGSLQCFMVPGDVRVFPVGNSSYNPATLLSLGADNDTYTVRVADVVYDAGVSGNLETEGIVNRTWFIEEANSGGAVLDLTLEWEQGEELLFDRNACGVAHWDGSQWQHPVAYTSATPVGGTRWQQTLTGQTTFSPFVVEDFQEQLPIELLDFEVHRISKDKVKLEWATASEIDNKGFEVERMLDNETTFAKVGFVEGYGNSVNTIRYGLYDDNAYSGVSYYRLRQLDYDGKATYSSIKAVIGNALVEEDIVQLYPNPARSSTNIRFGELTTKLQYAQVKVFDARGAVLQTFSVAVAAYQSFSIDTQELAAGAYYVEIDMGKIGKKVLSFVRL